MSFFKRKALAQIARPMVVLASIAVALLVNQSCSDKPTEKDEPGGPIHMDAPTMEIDMFPAWSPDGRIIAYFRDYAQNYDHSDTFWNWGVFLHNLDGGYDSLIWVEQQARDLEWSPDGKSLAFSRNQKIHIQNLRTNELYLIENPDRCFYPKWSPCGEKLIYFVRLGPRRGMYVYDTLSRQSDLEVPLAQAGSWLGGCDSIALTNFVDTPEGKLSVYSLSNRLLSDLPYLDSYKFGIAASPDGNSILICKQAGENHVNIWKFETTTGKYTALTQEGGDHPAWSPSGDWIVYTKVDSLNGHLWLMRPDGSEKHQITF